MAKVTLLDVSNHAGVSRATASLVLRNSPRISEPTKQKVKAAIDELGYVYNRQAAGMRDTRTMMLGLIATDIRNPYFAEVTMAIEEVIHTAGYTLLVGYTWDDLERQKKQIKAMVQLQVDGLILLPALGSSEDSFGRIVDSSEVPIVQIARYFVDERDFVGPNNRKAAESVAKHVASLGCTSAVLIGGAPNSSAGRERVDGLGSGFTGTSVHFDPSEAIPTPNAPDGGAAGLAVYLDSGKFADAVICYSDAIAQGVYSELRRRSIEPGVTTAIVSFDDLPFAALQYPPLTSVATYPNEIGRIAAELLLKRIVDKDAPVELKLVETTLKIRASTAQWRPRSSGPANI